VLLSLELDFVTASAPVDLEVTTTSSVTISGAWEGAVLFELCPGLDRLLAAAMFQAEKLGEDDVGDAIGELANIIGGNVKGLLLEPSRLSLPTVVSGRHLNLRMPGSVLVGELFGWCQSLPLRVSVWALLPGQPT
jgi:chemotaxis protein CheX